MPPFSVVGFPPLAMSNKTLPAWIQQLGSIKLAVPLLGAIASILVFATFYESEVGSTVVQQEIYKSPWFGALMFLLATNLAVSTLSRYPWKGARKIGFAITHWGLVVIIAGSAAVIHLSVEGMLLARTDAGAASTMRVEGDLVEVSKPGEPVQSESLFIKANGTVVPSKVGDLSLLAYSDRTMKTVRFEPGASVANPAVRLVLSSDRMGQSLERWLAIAPAAYNRMDVGPAELQIVRAETADDLKKVLTAERKVEKSSRWGELSVNWQGVSRSIDVAASLDEVVELSAKDKVLQLEVTDFWPDFRLDSARKPATASMQLNNPAVRLLVRQGESEESWFVFGNPSFDAIRTQVSGEPIAMETRYDFELATAEPDAFFKVVVDADEKLHYAAKSSKGFTAGPLHLGEPVVPGWADFTVTLDEYVPNALVKRDIVPLPDDLPVEGEPALLVAAEGGQPTWIPWGEPTAIASDTPGKDWYVAFSPKLLQLPFGLKLNDFIVERNEGSESVAMWTSEISLFDMASSNAVDRRVWMNHPTWFKGWKIAQASWNPGDLSQSTLQVKREPWWVTGLTWLGSMMVTVGVATMFYGRSVAKKFKKVSALLGGDETEGQDESVGTIPLFGAFLGR